VASENDNDNAKETTMTENINHTTYPKTLKAKSIESLRYIIQDCREALAANPAGHKAGYYQDEIHYAAAELRRRQLAA
jgi:hypothetical protein